MTGRRIAILGMSVSAALAVLKIATGAMAGSQSVLADGFESAADVLASGLVLLGLTVAAKPPDYNHPYGHGRAETVSGFLLGFILLSGGIAIAVHAGLSLNDALPAPAAYAIGPLLVSIAVKVWLVRLKYRNGRRIGSAALVADATNDGIDVLSGATALVALGLTLLDPVRFARADRYGALAVGLIVVITGIRVARETGLQLMDTMPDERLLDIIRETALAVPGVEGIEKCFARKTGLQYHVDLHVEVDPEISVRNSHEIAQQVREMLRERIQWVADVLVHVEPSPGIAAVPRAQGR